MQQLANPEPIAPAPTGHAVPVATTGAQLLAFIADQPSIQALRAGLLEVMDDVQVQRGTILHAIRHLEKRPTPPALVVDVSGVANPIDELERLSKVCAPDAKVLVIGDNPDIAFYRDLIRVMGVAEYLPKPIARDAVARIFAPMIAGVPQLEAATRGGSVVAVCGARGGVGATTVAVNLALQLAGTMRGHVALLDLHLSNGSAALQLGVEPGSGLRVALENPGRADALFLDRCAVPIGERLRLIAAQEPLDATPDPTPEGIRRVLEELSRRFNYIVVDLPVQPGPAERQVLRFARHLLVVLSPEVAAVRDAERIRRWAVQSGCSAPVNFVLNHAGLPGGLKPGLVREQLGVPALHVLPELGKPMLRAANLGLPAVRVSAAFRRALMPLASEFASVASRPARRSWLARMVRR